MFDIKVSDIIWTVICFGLFTLVLNKLLISPVLKHMDARRKRIEAASLRALEAENAAAEAERKRGEELEAAARAKAEEREARVREAERGAERELEELKARLESERVAKEAELEALSKAADTALESSMTAFEEAFAGKLGSAWKD